MLENYVASVALPVSREAAFAYHERAGALQRLVPPWESMRVEHSDGSLQTGSRVVLVNKIGPVPVRWVAEHTDYDPPRLFADTQLSGPFKHWDHRHEFEDLDNDGDGNITCRLTDRIAYQLPAGPAGRFFGGGLARGKIESMFAYRHRITADDLQLQADHPADPMTVAVSGTSGLVGGQLDSLLTLLGHRVRQIVRGEPGGNDSDGPIAVWHDESEADKLSDVDAVIHLAGKSIADQRWSDDVKREIRDSRVIKTRQLCEALARNADRAGDAARTRTLICASATGLYGNRGDEELNENSSRGDDFLAEVAAEWEQACRPAIDAGIRVVHARFGMILSPTGGALQKTLLPAKLFGGSLGSGRQWWSWIALDDVVGAIYQSLADDAIVGPVNFVSPQPIRNRDFAKTLGRVLRRPAMVPAPAVALRAALGEMADALLLSSFRVHPDALTKAGYRFRFETLEPFLRYVLGRDRLESTA